MGWARCSFVADQAGDPRVGTAPPAQRWFLVEHPGPWGPSGYAGSGLDTGMVAAAGRWARTMGGRILLVRRTDGATRNDPRGGRHWFRVDSRPGHESIRTGVFHDERELTGLLDADAQRDDAVGDDHTGPLALVCTHGKHDTCCAVRGRPVVAALARSHPEATWESSHIGGCRFAPALVLLPHGLVFGGVPATAAVELLDAYRNGVVDGRWLRGRSSLSPALQAAQQAAREHTGIDEVHRLRPDTITGGDGRWLARFADPPCAVHLTERRIDVDRPLTCRATRPGWMRVFPEAVLAPDDGVETDTATHRR